MKTSNHDLAQAAALLSDKTRASMLIALMAGSALTAGELALRANISPQTASNHLNKLIKGHLVICEPAGRHRYYKLASNEVAAAIEALGLLSNSVTKQRPPRHEKLDAALCFARTCYNHLAGELGVKLKDALVKKDILIPHEKTFIVSKHGEAFFKELNIDLNDLKKQKRQFAKACLDCTEREHHVAGSLGSAILNYLLQQRLIMESNTIPRAIILTAKGRNWFAEKLRIKQ